MAVRGNARKRSVHDPIGPENSDQKINADVLVRRSALLAEALADAGGAWSLENPVGSLLWRMPERVILARGACRILFDQCIFGAGIPNEGFCQIMDP